MTDALGILRQGRRPRPPTHRDPPSSPPSSRTRPTVPRRPRWPSSSSAAPASSSSRCSTRAAQASSTSCNAPGARPGHRPGRRRQVQQLQEGDARIRRVAARSPGLARLRAHPRSLERPVRADQLRRSHPADPRPRQSRHRRDPAYAAASALLSVLGSPQSSADSPSSGRRRWQRPRTRRSRQHHQGSRHRQHRRRRSSHRPRHRHRRSRHRRSSSRHRPRRSLRRRAPLRGRRVRRRNVRLQPRRHLQRHQGAAGTMASTFLGITGVVNPSPSPSPTSPAASKTSATPTSPSTPSPNPSRSSTTSPEARRRLGSHDPRHERRPDQLGQGSPPEGARRQLLRRRRRSRRNRPGSSGPLLRAPALPVLTAQSTSVSLQTDLLQLRDSLIQKTRRSFKLKGLDNQSKALGMATGLASPDDQQQKQLADAGMENSAAADQVTQAYVRQMSPARGDDPGGPPQASKPSRASIRPWPQFQAGSRSTSAPRADAVKGKIDASPRAANMTPKALRIAITQAGADPTGAKISALARKLGTTRRRSFASSSSSPSAAIRRLVTQRRLAVRRARNSLTGPRLARVRRRLLVGVGAAIAEGGKAATAQAGQAGQTVGAALNTGAVVGIQATLGAAIGAASSAGAQVAQAYKGRRQDSLPERLRHRSRRRPNDGVLVGIGSTAARTLAGVRAMANRVGTASGEAAARAKARTDAIEQRNPDKMQRSSTSRPHQKQRGRQVLRPRRHLARRSRRLSRLLEASGRRRRTSRTEDRRRRRGRTPRTRPAPRTDHPHCATPAKGDITNAKSAGSARATSPNSSGRPPTSSATSRPLASRGLPQSLLQSIISKGLDAAPLSGLPRQGQRRRLLQDRRHRRRPRRRLHRPRQHRRQPLHGPRPQRRSQRPPDRTHELLHLHRRQANQRARRRRSQRPSRPDRQQDGLPLMALTVTPTVELAHNPPRVLLTIDTTGYVGDTLAIYRVEGSESTIVRDSETTPDIADVTWIGYDYGRPTAPPSPIKSSSSPQAPPSPPPPAPAPPSPRPRRGSSTQATPTSQSSARRTAPDRRAQTLHHPSRPARPRTLRPRRHLRQSQRRRRLTPDRHQHPRPRSPPSSTSSPTAPVAAQRPRLAALGSDLQNGSPWATSTGARVVAQGGARPHRLFSASYLVVARPEGDLLPQRTWADVISESSSWTDVLTTRATWANVFTGS